ncbi:hypothetical protein ACHHYP_12956 [Achlya hypogyna]|uniref:Uncharacterized protein n=1 Tax=Achlya hypogyna TaxID=1202772 RepID=A0A1V9ZGR7_ACHHY|nr:hypothetical protein ACHHYP_12956 [Achlya hypogyna]
MYRNHLWRTMRSHYIASPGVDLCVPGYPTRPFFCEQSWIDFGALGVDGITRIMEDIQLKMVAAQSDVPTQRVDMVLLEGFDDFRPWIGGLALAGTSAFDVVTLLRVQNCTDAHHTQCTTVAITDYRYEGTMGRTATRNYYRFVRLLRLVGQLYNIGRVALLFAGCYFARTVEAKYARAPLKTKLWCALRTFLRIPAQVVIYGSWFPVLLFSIAHIVDVSFLYATIFYGFIVLNGTFNLTLPQLYTFLNLLTCHMRNVWLLSLASKAVLLAGPRRHRPTIMGFRGYLLPLVSFISVIFDVRLNSERDTHLEHIHPTLPNAELTLLREFHGTPSDYRYWGIFSDIKHLLISGGLVYIVGGILLREPMTLHSVVPYTLLRHCSRSMFSTAWQAAGRSGVASHVELLAQRQAMSALQHITWMTDPIQYLSLLWHQPVVYVYTIRDSDTDVYHALAPRELAQVDKALSKTVEGVEEVLLLELTWRERICCHQVSVPSTARRTLLALMSYCLFFTDIPRSGYGTKVLPLRDEAATETMYTNFGPYNYPIIAISKAANGAFQNPCTHSLLLKGSFESSIPLAKVWSYKYDTCSLGLRTIVTQHNLSTWDPCLLYNSECAHSMLEPHQIFPMLENVIETIQNRPSPTLRVDYIFTDIINDLFTIGTFRERGWRTVHAHYIPTPGIDVCELRDYARPLFCDQPWANFSALGVGGMAYINDDFMQRMNAAANGTDPKSQRVDMAFIVAIDDMRPWGGGIASTHISFFDVVTLLRVQNCSKGLRTNCTTISISDFRYEGGLGQTTVIRYYALVRLLRLVGQLYNIGRVFALLAGCYAAQAAEPWFASAQLHRKVGGVLHMFFRIPAQVVIYGSWFPVTVFVLAHVVDAPFVYSSIFIAFSALNGNFNLTPDQVYGLVILLTCHMRNVWLLSLATKLALLVVNRNGNETTIVGFRGYLLPFVSMLSIVFEVRLNRIRDTSLEYVVTATSNPETLLVRELHSIPTNYRYWGVFADVKTLAISFSFVYIVFGILCGQPLSFRTRVPYTLVRYCNRTMFSTAWASVATPSVRRVRVDAHGERNNSYALLHITWMTDPIQHLSLLWHQPSVYAYRVTATGRVLHHELSARELRRVEPKLSETLECIGVDIEANIPLTWRRALFACSSYLLFFTDIPRSGFGFNTLPPRYHAATETLFSNFGPYSYPIITVTKTVNGSVEGSIPQAKVWSYKFDTCSVGLRTIVSQYNVSGWDRCLLYESECATSMLDPAPLLTMLESVAETVRVIPSPTWRVGFYFIDIINDVFAFGKFSEQDLRTVRTHYVSHAGIDLCAPGYPTRANFCDQPWTNFGALGVEGMTSIMGDIQSKVAAATDSSDPRTQVVDMAIVEAVDDLRPWTGGLALAYLSPFDVITLLRVRNCTDTTKTNCSTVAISDHRYEGGLGKTSTRTYYGLVYALRFVGQAYNIGRVLALLVGCYYARACEDKYQRAPLQTKFWVMLTTCLRIPAQVVIYGSWFPVLLFVTAHLIDSPFLYFSIFMELGTLNGTFNLDVSQLYYFSRLLTCHMRNVWLLSLVAKTILLAMDNRRHHSILGFRGYLLPFVSFVSILFEIRLNALRNTDLIYVTPHNPSNTTLFVRELHTLPSNYRFWGAYSDIKNLFSSFVAVCVIFRGVLGQPVTMRTSVPHTLLRYCHRTMFSTTWYTTDASTPQVHSQADLAAQRRSRAMLMHITWMTDPLQHLSLLWMQPVVYTYRCKTSGKLLHHVLSLRELERKDAEFGASIEYVSQAFLLELSWRDRIRQRPLGPRASDIDTDVPLTLPRVFVTCFSYMLFLTDIPRSGYGFKDLPADYYSATETLYTNFGPYDYPIIALTRTTNGSVSGSIPQAKVWSYKFDTCSVGLRTVVSQYNVSDWDPCILYARDCPHKMIDPTPLFTMLDNVVSAVHTTPPSTWRVNYYFVDIINDIFAHGAIKERDWRTVRSHYLSSPVDLCDAQGVAPFFCDQAWVDFGALGGSPFRIMTSILDRFRTKQQESDSVMQVVDMAIIEGIDDLRPWAGGFAKAYLSAYDVVTLLRVRNCSDVGHSNCTTVLVSDYRYEGGLGRTNTRSYFKLTRMLRFMGQLYNIGRAGALFLGCYIARTRQPQFRRAPLDVKLWGAATLFLRIPAQVVIYGSWFPVLLFVTAHLIDSPFLYFTIYMDLGTLNGSFNLNASQLYYFSTLLTCHMRNVWLLSAFAKAALVLLGGRRHQALLGVRGYLLPVASFCSMLFEIRLIVLRNTDLLHVCPVIPSRSVALAREYTALPTNYRYWGVFSDVKNLFLSSCLVYTVSLFFLRNGVIFATTMPHTLLRFCNRTMFCTCWSAVLPEASMYITKVHTQGHLKAYQRSINMLMHITWMTDPIQYLSLLYMQPVVHAYRLRETGQIVFHPMPLRELVRLDASLSDSFEWVADVFLMDLPWHERIQCH